MKWITALFIVVLLLIVLVANLGYGPQVFSFVYLIPGGDKVGHLILMGLLSFLVNLSLLASKVRIFSVNFLKGSLIVMGVVTLEEFSQLFLKFRGFSLVDLLFDYGGIFLFGYFAAYFVKWRKGITSKSRT